MRKIISAVLVLAGLAGTVAHGQRPKSLTSKVKGALKGAVDSAATKAAAAVVDSALGTGDTRLAGAGCPAGMVPAASATVGSALVKKARGKAKPDSALPTPSCVPDGNASAMTQQQAMLMQEQAARAQAMAAATAAQAAQPSAGAMAGAMAAATPIGLAATAAPAALKGVKALGGMLGKGGPSAAGMIKDLSTKGRLELKGVKFIGASDAMEPGFEDDLAMLAEALGSIEGAFVVNIPAEAADKAEPDTVMARRRIGKLSAHFAVAGIKADRVSFVTGRPGLDASKRPPKLGEAKVEILRAPEQQ